MSSLRSGGLALLACAFLLGCAAMGLWMWSNARWQGHLDRAEITGVLLHEALVAGNAVPPGLVSEPLTPRSALLADQNQFEQLPDAPRPVFVTQLNILADSTPAWRGAPLTLAILSPDLRYPLARLTRRPDQPQAETMAANGRETLSPTPPVECLSTLRPGTWDRSATVPECIIASV